MYMAQNRYRNDCDKNLRTSLTFEVGEFVYLNKPSLAVLASEPDKVYTVSYNKLVPRMTGLYMIVTVRDNPLTILNNGADNTISMGRATNAPCFREEPDTNGVTHNTRSLSRTQANETNNSDNGQVVVEKKVIRVKENGDPKYFVPL